MRLNKFLALNTSLSRRSADKAVEEGRVEINGLLAKLGDTVIETDKVELDGKKIVAEQAFTTIMLNKPVGFVCSKNGQGSSTIYELLPTELHHLNPVGRLDKNSSGLLLLTNDGDLAHKLTHPRYQKEKRYIVELNKDLSEEDFEIITKSGVQLPDGTSKLGLDFVNDGNTEWKVSMHEGRNRQIRRTFEKLGYEIISLHRTHFGPYELGTLKPTKYREIEQ